MLTHIIPTIVNSQRLFVGHSLRLLYITSIRLTDRDHGASKALEKAAHDLKVRKEQRWLDTVASDSGKKIVYTYAYYIQIFISEAIVKAEKQYEKKQGHPAKDHSELQEDTIQAIKEKEEKGHLPQFDVGRYDRREDRIGSGGSHKKA